MMSGSNLIDTSRNLWQDIFKKVNKAVVFLDDQFAECLHWLGGASTLVTSGAVDIKQFSSFESGKVNQRKAVFLVSQPVFSKVEQILCDILRNSRFEYAILITSTPPGLNTVVRYGQVDDENKAFHHLEEIMLDCMGSKNFTADLVYIPLTCAPITSNMFVLPGHEAMFPLLHHHWQDIFVQASIKMPNPTPADLDSSELPIELQRNSKLLAYGINAVLEQLGVADDVYCMGDTSRLVATDLAGLAVAKPRRKNSQKKASVVVIDRTVDLSSILGHHSDTLLDNILYVNKPLPGHQNDVAVDMAPLCNVHPKCADAILPGCLAHNSDHIARDLFDTIASAKQKQALHEMKLQVQEAVTGNDLDFIPHQDQSTIDFLQSNISLYKGKSSLLRQHSGLLQLVRATVDTLKHPDMDHHASLLGIEKGFLQSIGDEGTTPLMQIVLLLEQHVQLSENERTYSLDDILGMLAYAYALYPNPELIDSEQEQQLKPLLVRCLMETPTEHLPSCIHQSLDGRVIGDVVTEIVSNIIKTLRSLTHARENFRKFRHAYQEGGMTSQACLTPLLEQLTREIFAPNSKQEVPDLEFKSTGFRDLLKSGFGLFMNVSKPRPNDHPLLIIFVIGGISSSEAKLIQQTVDQSNTSTKVLIGSTRIATPSNIVQQLFAKTTDV